MSMGDDPTQVWRPPSGEQPTGELPPSASAWGPVAPGGPPPPGGPYDPGGPYYEEPEPRRNNGLLIALGALVAILAIAVIVVLVTRKSNDKASTGTTTTTTQVTTTTTSTTSTTAPSTTAPPTTAKPTTTPPATQKPTTAPPATPPPTTKPPDATVTSFKSAAATVDCSGGTAQVNLSWSTQNATAVTIGIDNPGPYDTYAPTGSAQLPYGCGPAQHTYYLVAKGAGGSSATSQLTITAKQ